MMGKTDVLLTYGWNRVAYQILRNLSKHNLRVITADESKYNMCSQSIYKYKYFTYPNPYLNQQDFIKLLIKKVDKYRPDVLMPVHEESFIIAKNRDKFPKNLIIPISDYETLLKAHDKLSASRVAKSAGVNVPKIYNIEEALSFGNRRFVLKLTRSNGAKGVFYTESKNDLERLYRENKESNFYIQDYVEGEGYGASILYDKGKMIAGFVHKRLTEKTHTGGVSTKRISVKNNIILSDGKKILDKLKWHGVAMVEFKYDEENNVNWFIEINARYWGSLALPIAAGLDIPYWHYCIATGKDFTVNDYKSGIISKWVLGEFITLVERVQNRKLTMKELKSIVNFNADNFDDYYPDDRKAFIGELYYYFKKFMKTRSVNPEVKGIEKV